MYANPMPHVKGHWGGPLRLVGKPAIVIPNSKQTPAEIQAYLESKGFNPDKATTIASMFGRT